MSFTELSHTADVKIRVRAPTLDTLFSDALDALMQVMYGKDRKGGILKEIVVESADYEALLADFLSEILYLSEVDGLVFSRAEIRIAGGRLHAMLDGEPFDPARHAGGSEVKGISYSGMSITRDTNGYMLDIIFDV
ncbi:MAG: archease [Methanoregula sp.]|nr:archease [Methanoregula sp.]